MAYCLVAFWSQSAELVGLPVVVEAAKVLSPVDFVVVAVVVAAAAAVVVVTVGNTGTRDG